MSAEPNDLRETLERAFDESQAGGQAEDTAQPVRTEAETPTREPATDRPAEARTERVRDERGKFARKDAAPAADPAPVATDRPAAAPAAPAPDAAAAPVDPFAKAPQSWKPGAREAWQQLPSDVRAEVHRREKEAATVMQETAQARQVYNHLGTLQQQYAPALQAEGVDVLTATQNLMNLASRLRFGTPPEKAQLAAQIIRTYGVDIETLAAALDNQPMPQQQQQRQGMYQDPRVDQLLGELNAAKQARAEAAQREAVNEVEQFGAGKEFFEDVREDMADILEFAARRKIDLPLEQAYERACALNPDIAKVIEGRRKATAAGTAQQSTQRARAAASSVKGTPSGVSTPDPGDLRGAIEAAIEAADGR